MKGKDRIASAITSQDPVAAFLIRCNLMTAMNLAAPVGHSSSSQTWKLPTNFQTNRPFD